MDGLDLESRVLPAPGELSLPDIAKDGMSGKFNKDSDTISTGRSLSPQSETSLTPEPRTEYLALRLAVVIALVFAVVVVSCVYTA